jgi:4-amino-4-deoxy-L-arabinose transferase-like glycosyltransferase
VLCLGAFVAFLGTEPLWNIDEGMHAAMAKDMLVSGDWVTPRFNGTPFLDKPPLFIWLVAASLRVLGLTEFAARLPSALLACVAVVLTYRFGRSAVGGRAGVLSALTLATSVAFVVMARVEVHDMTLTACTTLALVSFWRFFRGDGSARVNLGVMYASTAVGLLVKGPVAAALIGLVIVAFLAIAGRLDVIPRMRPVWGALLVLAVSAPWYVAMEAANPGYLRYFLVTQHLFNVAGSHARHAEPFWFYGVTIIGGLLPWSVYLPQAFWNAWTARGSRRDHVAIFLLVWTVAPTVLLSLASSKLHNYLLPVFPAAALLVGTAWGRLIDRPSRSYRRSFVVSTVVTLALLVAAAVTLATTGLDRFRTIYDFSVEAVVLPLGILCAGVAATAILVAIGRSHVAATALATTVILFFWTVVLSVLPHLSPYRSNRELALVLDRLVPQDAPVAHYARLRDSMLFYGNTRAVEVDTPKQLVTGIREGLYAAIVIDRRDAKAIPRLGRLTREAAREGRVLLLMPRNRRGTIAPAKP